MSIRGLVKDCLEPLGFPEMRLCQQKTPDTGEMYYDFHIVYVDEKGEPLAWEAEPFSPWGYDPEDLMMVLHGLVVTMMEKSTVDLDSLARKLQMEVEEYDATEADHGADHDLQSC